MAVTNGVLFLLGRDEPDVVDSVAVRFELPLDRAVSNFIDTVEELVAGTDSGLVQQKTRGVAERERKHLTGLSVQGMPTGEREVREVERDHNLETDVRHVKTLCVDVLLGARATSSALQSPSLRNCSAP